MSKKRNFKPEKYETVQDAKGCNISSVIFMTMLTHPNFQELSQKQKVLYVYMKLQKYGAGEYRPKGKTNDYFYFNWEMASKIYKLYTNHKRFYDDVYALANKGFIRIIENNKHRLDNNIYQYSDDWKQIGYDGNVQKPVQKRTVKPKKQGKDKKQTVQKRTEKQVSKTGQTHIDKGFEGD